MPAGIARPVPLLTGAAALVMCVLPAAALPDPMHYARIALGLLYPRRRLQITHHASRRSGRVRRNRTWTKFVVGAPRGLGWTWRTGGRLDRLHTRLHLWWVYRWVRRSLVVAGARCPLTKPAAPGGPGPGLCPGRRCFLCLLPLFLLPLWSCISYTYFFPYIKRMFLHCRVSSYQTCRPRQPP
jgi:hypothetical protein